MPVRPRSHRLEDISINRFTALLPEAWVVRRKEQDYGVDLEVEIFEDDGRSTGLIFLVQLRATDDPKKAKKIRLDVEQVGYFQSLSLPTIIVRYCDDLKSFFWQWHFNVAIEIPGGEAKTFTYHYAAHDDWDAESAANIRQTLGVRRLIEDYPASRPVHISGDSSALGFADRYNLERAIEDVIQGTPGTLASTPFGPGALSISVFGKPGSAGQPAQLIVVIDCFASLTIEVAGFDRADTATAIRYALAALLDRHQLTHHAHRIAQAIVAAGVPAANQFLALGAALALSTDLERSVSLALLNNIHALHDQAYVSYIAFLFRMPQEDEGREAAVERFYAAALKSARSVSPETAATVHYSLGNFYRIRQRGLQAIQQFNRARKLRPAYLDTDYFLPELGACLFGSRRYNAAAKIYRRALAFDDGPQHQLHLGDALLFAGKFRDAKSHFNKARSADNVALDTEALVKSNLCDWLESEFGATPRNTARSEVNKLTDGVVEQLQDVGFWRDILSNIDVTSELAHFNLGVEYASNGDQDRALGHFLFCAFKNSGDADAWANAMVAAYNSEDAAYLVAVMTCAHSLAGTIAYDRLRELLRENNAPDGQIEGLDTVFREVSALIEGPDANSLTFRAIRQNSYDAAVLV